MAKLFIEDLELEGKKVITRVDFNVPLREGQVDNDKRLRASLPTIEYLKAKGAKVILMSHLGRPKGSVVENMRMAPVAARLGELLGCEVKTVADSDTFLFIFQLPAITIFLIIISQFKFGLLIPVLLTLLLPAIFYLPKIQERHRHQWIHVIPFEPGQLFQWLQHYHRHQLL